MSEWQPIETAPKDGTQVVLFRPERLFTVAWWDSDWAEWQMVGGSMLRNPTHWMPLPEPPA